jgi:hypothetical protein
LTVLWNVNINAERARWTASYERLEEARQLAQEDNTQRQQDLRDEKGATCLEDKEKNKNKYAPLKYIKIPTDPTILLPNMQSVG